MKKIILIAGLIVLALGALGAYGVSAVLAQGELPPMTLAPGASAGVGRGNYGWMHDYVEQALAAKLGLTEKQVEDLLAEGKPMYQIALDNGIAQEKLTDFMTEVHKEAFDKAVADGVITRERADWMLQRMQTMQQSGFGPGNCPMHNGQGGTFERGRGMGPGMMNGGRGSGWMWSQGTETP
ncbi:MAG TPA: hypothetical protein VK897_14310 [Anaerolineales bacterium]|nr:hypothetical protein [Anaerolineales bacterium]